MGYKGEAPVLEFLNKGAHFSSITGEKLSEFQVVAAVKKGFAELGLPLEHFTVAPVMQSGRTTCCWSRRMPARQMQTVGRADRNALCQMNSEYAEKVRTGRLKPLVVQEIAPGPGGVPPAANRRAGQPGRIQASLPGERLAVHRQVGKLVLRQAPGQGEDVMSGEKILVTGATGMIGSLVARRAVESGYRVRVLVRPTSDRKLLEGLDLEYVEGDLADPESLPAALRGIDMVVHAAAHIGDWGPADKYRAINVIALEHLLTAAEHEGRLRRWVQVSSLGVYPARDHYGTDETVPPDMKGLDGYTRTKAEAEVLLRRHMDDCRLPAVIVRPGFVYGPGERAVIPRLIKRFESGVVKFIGDGKKVLNNTYVGNLADAILLAMEKDEALGETFNIRDERLVTRQEYIMTVADYLGKPRPGSVPLWLARTAVPVIEGLAKLRGGIEPPLLTGATLKFMALNLDFSIAKAKAKLAISRRSIFGKECKRRWTGRRAGDRVRESRDRGEERGPETEASVRLDKPNSPETLSMRIVELSLFAVRVPLKREVRHAAAARSESENLLARCRLADGSEGWGEGVPREYVTGETIDGAFVQLAATALASQFDVDCSAWDDVLGLCERFQLHQPREDPRRCYGTRCVRRRVGHP